MTFRNRLQYFLVKKLKISNKEALQKIINGNITLNGEKCIDNCEITETDTIEYINIEKVPKQAEVLQVGKKLVHIIFYKPRGIETTLNLKIANNLKEIMPFEDDVFPVGRLDKESEGLLLLTNNGKIFDKTLRQEHEVEKEYLVTVNKPITSQFLEKMASGVDILGKTTKPAQVKKISEKQFCIIITQGLNRQIRRMCYKCDYEVIQLVRTRIGNYALGNLKPLEYKYL